MQESSANDINKCNVINRMYTINKKKVTQRIIINKNIHIYNKNKHKHHTGMPAWYVDVPVRWRAIQWWDISHRSDIHEINVYLLLGQSVMHEFNKTTSFSSFLILKLLLIYKLSVGRRWLDGYLAGKNRNFSLCFC